jgi:hypothetical protein
VQVIVQTPDCISAITGDVYILRFRAEDKILERRMGLEETAVLLRFKQSDVGFMGNRSEVQPRRCHVDRRFFFSEEDELGDDLLRPGCSGLVPACDDDVVGAEREVIPSCRVHVVVLEFGGFHGPLLIVHCLGGSGHVGGELLLYVLYWLSVVRDFTRGYL